MAKRKKVKHHYLDAEHRPLFPVMHIVQENAKDKERKRSYQKKQLKKELESYED